MLYFLYLLGASLAKLLPRRWCYLIAKFLALAQFRFSKKDRQTVIYNLNPIFNDAKKTTKYAREVFINFAYYLADFFRHSKITKNFIKKYVRITGLENVDASFSTGKGIIALTAHLGNYEFAGALVSSLGYSVAAVALPHKNKHINKFFNERRYQANIKVIPTGSAVKGCLSVLKQKSILALLGDRDFSNSGHIFEMFSRPARFPRGPAYFSLKSGAVIIPAFLIRENRDYYHLFFEEPIDASGKTDEQEIIKSYIPILEKYIKLYPGQWYMFGKYWLEE
ncbi:MAG: lysophospholipid acyltransferase family protein [Candidatus Omnitrophica bacterium]|jgi:KDO2-lipid IV(A) lauroyltransferase|nr:lysophospholipid acyltransferase family protein [Candidatus Omnitrophota bacterium]